MEKVLEKFKNLFKGEQQLKRHLMLMLLMLLPAVTGAMGGVIDKDTPKELLLILGLLVVVFLLLSIIPLLFLSGFTADFYILKRKGIKGLPAVNFDTLLKGLKVLPLYFVWGFYELVVFAVLVVAPAVCIGAPVFSTATPNPLGIIILVVAVMVLYFIALAVFMVLAPFFNYVYFSFIEDFEYRAEYFNPLVLIKYIKLVFKDTMITMLKYLLVSMVVNTALSVVLIVVMLLIGLFAAVPAVILEEPASTIASLFVIVPMSALCSIIQFYVLALIGFAAGDTYMDIYKEYIRIPDPLEEQQALQTDKPDDGWSNQKI